MCLQDGRCNTKSTKSEGDLSVVGLLTELISDSDGESEEHNDDNVLIELTVSR